MRFFDLFRKNKADAAASSPDPSTSADDERSAYAKYMTGQLIALYKQTHLPEYQTEYMTRLKKSVFRRKRQQDFSFWNL